MGDGTGGCMFFCCFELGLKVLFCFLWRIIALHVSFHSCADLVCLRAAILQNFSEAEKT